MTTYVMLIAHNNMYRAHGPTFEGRQEGKKSEAPEIEEPAWYESARRKIQFGQFPRVFIRRIVELIAP